MNFEEFTNFFAEKIWFREFFDNWRRIDSETLQKISVCISREYKKRSIDGLYEFSQFLYYLVYQQ